MPPRTPRRRLRLGGRTSRAASRSSSRFASSTASGFTLLESVVALGIVAVGALGLAAAMATSLKHSQRSRSLTQAMYLAEQQIETFASMDGADVLTLMGDPLYPNDPQNPLDPDPNDGDATTFNRRWTIQPNTPEAGTMTLTVQVDWIDPAGITQTVQLETVKASL